MKTFCRIRWSENLNYGFANGRVRAQETSLLDRNQYERLLKANGVEEFLAALTETRYGQFVNENAEPSQIFTAAHQENIRFCKTYAAELWLKALIGNQADIFNLKVILKNRYQEKSTASKDLLSGGEWSLNELNAITASELKRPFAEQKILVLAHRCAQEALRLAREKQDPSMIDLLLDKLAQEQALIWATGNDFASGYFRLYADLMNIRTLIRLKVLNETVATLEAAFLPGGEISRQNLQRAYESESGAVKGVTLAPPFGALLLAGRQAQEAGASLLPIENMIRQLLLDYINCARYIALGYEPLWRFFLLRENELTNLRQIYAAKLAGWDMKQCQEVVVYGF